MKLSELRRKLSTPREPEPIPDPFLLLSEEQVQKMQEAQDKIYEAAGKIYDMFVDGLKPYQEALKKWSETEEAKKFLASYIDHPSPEKRE